MTIYGTPGGTPLNTTPFQGTQPGNAVGATLPGLTPGVGLFPPNSNNASGETVHAAVSRGALPINALTTVFGQKHHPTAGRTIMDTLVDTDQDGAGVSFVANGGSPNLNPCGSGGGNAAAGGLNQTQGPGAGSAMICPANAPSNLPAVAVPQQFGG